MGKKNRSSRRFRPVEEPKEELTIVVEDVVEVTEEPQPVKEVEVITDVVPFVQPVRPRPSPTYNPNSATGLLNSILTTLLTQEYNRLHQQLLNIKQQLDAQKMVSEPIIESTIDENTTNEYTDVTEEAQVVSDSQQTSEQQVQSIK